MITLHRKYYPVRIKDEKAEGFPYGTAVEDTLEFQSWASAVSFVEHTFRTDQEAAQFDNVSLGNGVKCLILRDRKGRIYYQLKSAA